MRLRKVAEILLTEHLQHPLAGVGRMRHGQHATVILTTGSADPLFVITAFIISHIIITWRNVTLRLRTVRDQQMHRLWPFVATSILVLTSLHQLGAQHHKPLVNLFCRHQPIAYK